MKEGAGEILDAAAAAFGALEQWTAEPLKAALERAGEHSRIAPRWTDANAAFDAACGAFDRILKEERT